MSIYGFGSLRKRGDRWYLRIFSEGKQSERAIIDPTTGKYPATKAHAERLALVMRPA
jgi:hypothetical protein